jgi:hypothetical protein
MQIGIGSYVQAVYSLTEISVAARGARDTL